MTSRPTVLVLRCLGLGDFVTGVPALRAVRDAFPDHRILLATRPHLAPLVSLADAVDAIAPSRPLTHLGSDCLHPDVAVNLHGRGPQSHRVLLATRPGRLLAFAHRDVPECATGPEWVRDEHEIDRWCRMLTECGVPADERRTDLCRPDVPPPAAAIGATIVHPGASRPSRRWPVERFAAVARRERAAGRSVVVTGSVDERALAHRLAELAELPTGAVLAGSLDLADLAAAVAVAGRVVSGDTGVAHLATAYRVPSVVLFGPVPPSRWGPPTDRPWHRALWAGRTGDPHAMEPHPGLLDLSVDDVLQALDELDHLDDVRARGADDPLLRRAHRFVMGTGASSPTAAPSGEGPPRRPAAPPTVPAAPRGAR
ncbi:MAG TPA: glycosyltransferase family 9 protein [Acidimicrobiia bacterium]|nr:glycosyltransferase family 9 protein [Acidimicrobiia bacterium]